MEKSWTISVTGIIDDIASLAGINPKKDSGVKSMKNAPETKCSRRSIQV